MLSRPNSILRGKGAGTWRPIVAELSHRLTLAPRIAIGSSPRLTFLHPDQSLLEMPADQGQAFLVSYPQRSWRLVWSEKRVEEPLARAEGGRHQPVWATQR